jgi:hypothetical protein
LRPAQIIIYIGASDNGAPPTSATLAVPGGEKEFAAFLSKLKLSAEFVSSADQKASVLNSTTSSIVTSDKTYNSSNSQRADNTGSVESSALAG